MLALFVKLGAVGKVANKAITINNTAQSYDLCHMCSVQLVHISS